MNTENFNILDIQAKILESVKQSIDAFRTDPFLFMSERDIQAHLFCLLRQNIGHTIIFHRDKKDYKTGIINTEYSHSSPEWKDYIDIVCIHPNKASELVSNNTEKKLNEYLWSLPVLAGIEIKLVRSNENKGSQIGDDDKEKLKRFNEEYNEIEDFLWLVLCFFQNKEKLEKLNSKEEFSNDIKFNQIYLIGEEKLYIPSTK